jgi:NAD(P)-dependent dehydrogenase (short-subunit alcohol dehydrogenase family)
MTSAVLIVGATGGIGSALARRLATSGTSLFLAGRDEARLVALSAELGASYAVVDATDFADMDRIGDRAHAELGRLDGMVNCAGSLLLKPAHLTKSDEFHATIATNLTTAFAVVRTAARLMTDGGTVVLCSSAAARIGLANHEAIAAAKAGILGLMLSAAATYGARGLRVNAVAPGLVRTPMTARITASATAADASRAMHALGRLGEPDDVAAMIAWLLSDDARWITGQCFGVDGGLGTVRAK